LDRVVELNPIIRFELIRAARWRRHHLMRAALGLIPLCVVWFLYDEMRAATKVGGQEKSILFRQLPQLADLVFLGLTLLQGLAVVLMVPGLVAGSIAEEDRRGTMIDLLATPLSSGAIVLGKLAARLVHVGVAVCVGLPVVLPMALLGALDPLIVAYAYALLIALTLFVGSLSLLVSVIIRNPRFAIPVAYLVVGGWFLLPVWFSRVGGRLAWPLSWLRVFTDWILQSHPAEAALYLGQICTARLSYPPAVAWAWAGLLKAFPRVVGLQVVCSALFLLLAALCLRPLRLGLWVRRGYALAVPAHPAIYDDPMLWKEWYAPARLVGGAVRLAAILLGVLLFCPLIEPVRAAFLEWRASWWARPARVWAREVLNESLRQLNAGIYVLGVVAIAAIAATSITGERERGTWTSLATTLVTGREIVRAKVSGAIWALRGLSIPFLTLWVIGLVTGSAHPLGVLAAAAGLIIFARYAAALGVFVSMVSSTSDRAIATTLLALMMSNAFALLFIPLNLIGPLAGSWSTVYLAGVTPLVEWISLASPVEFRQWQEGRIWEGLISLPGGLWSTRIRLDPGFFWTYVVSLTLHALGTVAMMRVTAWLFDSEGGGLWRPSIFTQGVQRVRQRARE
jgi:ABC-type transport system involved in multi-copper enzyme maturation permease subunit